MLYETMKKDRIAAMKAKDKALKDTLTTFIGDLDSEEKRGTTIDDSMVIARLKKSIQNAKDNHDLTNDPKFLDEISIYESYLPKQLSDDELSTVIDEILNGKDKPNIGIVMKELKAEYDGQFDGKVASSLIRGKLA